MADMTCFSFHPVKTVTGGEGGAILTNDEELYKKLILAHTHGITHDEKMMEGAGFTVMSDEDERISLNLGYASEGFAEKVYHVHLRRAGDNDELYFRDYLNAHPQTAREYEALKLRLWKRFEHDRNAYTDAKTGFIKAVTAKARVEYAGRY